MPEEELLLRSPFFTHALGTPLTTLQVNLELLSSLLPAELQPYVTGAQSSAKRLETLLTLTTQKSAGKSIFFPVAAALQELVIFFKHAYPQTTLLTHLELPYYLKLTGHPFYFQEALLCLLTNAAQSYTTANQNPPITLTSELLSNTLRLSVIDGGQGMRWWQRPLVLAEGVSWKTKGSGYGLPWVKQVVQKQLGGRVIIDSNYGRGTTVTLTLPLTR